MFQMSRFTFLLLSACLLVILTCHCDASNYSFCASVFCVGIDEKDCPGNYIEADPNNGICCSGCTVTKGEFCASCWLSAAECLSRRASIEIILYKVRRRIMFTQLWWEDRVEQSGCDRELLLDVYPATTTDSLHDSLRYIGSCPCRV